MVFGAFSSSAAKPASSRVGRLVRASLGEMASTGAASAAGGVGFFGADADFFFAIAAPWLTRLGNPHQLAREARQSRDAVVYPLGKSGAIAVIGASDDAGGVRGQENVELVEVAPVHRWRRPSERCSMGEHIGIGNAPIGPAGLVSSQYIAAKPAELGDDSPVHVLVAE
jgi:hypothetical protein